MFLTMMGVLYILLLYEALAYRGDLTTIYARYLVLLYLSSGMHVFTKVQQYQVSGLQSIASHTLLLVQQYSPYTSTRQETSTLTRSLSCTRYYSIRLLCSSYCSLFVDEVPLGKRPRLLPIEVVQPLLHEQFFDVICPDRPTYKPMEYTSCVDKAVGQTSDSLD